ncbi:ion channel [Thalassolituus maritimus]
MKFIGVNGSMIVIGLMSLAYPAVGKYCDGYAKLTLVLFSVLTIVLGMFLLYLFLVSWEARDKARYKIFPFYVDVCLSYSLFYTFAAIASPSGGFISGLHEVCSGCTSYQNINLFEVYTEIPHLFLDSVYYSVVNMTTLGDGSISPQNVLKFVVISQVGFTFYLTVFGVAEYFGRETTRELEKVNVELRKISGSSSADVYEKKECPIPIRQRLFVSLKGLITGNYS